MLPVLYQLIARIVDFFNASFQKCRYSMQSNKILYSFFDKYSLYQLEKSLGYEISSAVLIYSVKGRILGLLRK